jgi:hypothetical protein
MATQPITAPVPKLEPKPEPKPAPISVPEPTPHEAKPELPVPVAASAPSTEHRRISRALPENLVLVYNVLAGEGGFKLGQATYTWRVNRGGYHLESVAQASGLASLFVSGSIVQTSKGRMAGSGLIPELFTQTKSERRQDTARFDWVNKRLILADGHETLRPGTQDLLSFPFHLAMTVEAGDKAWVLPVTNGRKLKGYDFALLGRERLEVVKTSVETLHVQGSRAGDGSLDVWLAPTRHWLPMRIRTQDEKGKVIELNLAKLSDE